jgi:hypothetical protein
MKRWWGKKIGVGGMWRFGDLSEGKKFGNVRKMEAKELRTNFIEGR